MIMTPRRLLLACAAALQSTPLVYAEHWAVIVAGSRGYENYRHQADACHAYHVVRRHGIPKENVVLMMYDDVATASENPFKGQLFNKPSKATEDDAPVDVYAGCEVDYRGEDVTPENFLNVLLGNSTATNGKKVLASGPEDRVFVNFVDHGARGFVVFPHGQMLTSSQLVGAMQKMYGGKRYKELVFYVEACHAGSMFWSWSMSRINAYVTTAANGWESSWGTYCPPMDVVNGTALNTCLGDLYSVNWMEDSDRTDLSSESLRQQFGVVKQKTAKSHVEQFGSNSVRKEIVGNFQSNYDSTAEDEGEYKPQLDTFAVERTSSAVATSDIRLVMAFYEYLRASTGQEKADSASTLLKEIAERQKVDRIFTNIRQAYAQLYNHELPVQAVPAQDISECQAQAIDTFGEVARREGLSTAPDLPSGFTSYSLQYAGVLSDLCTQLGDIHRVRRVLQCATGEGCLESIRQTQMMD